MKNIAQLSVDNLEKTLRSIPEFANKSWSLINEDQLFSKATGVRFPCAGVVYEGLRAGSSSEGAGKSSEITCSIYVLYLSGTIGNVDYKPRAVEILDKLRDKIMDTMAPSGHKWVFKFESPAEDMHKALVYYQRWSAKVIL